MSENEPLDPMPDDVRALLDAIASDREPAPAGARDRVIGRLAASIDPGGGGDGGGDGGARGGDASGGGARGGDASGGAASGGAASGGGLLAGGAGGAVSGAPASAFTAALTSRALLAGLSLVVGAVGGAVGGAALHAAATAENPPQVVYVDRPARDPFPTATTVARDPAPGPAPAPDEGAAQPKHSANGAQPARGEPGRGEPPPASTNTNANANANAPANAIAKANGARDDREAGGGAEDDRLAAERALLEVARAALSRGDREGAEAALTALGRHEARFPTGQLAEEREALAVRALKAAGRIEDAKARAARFRARYPQSMLRGVVDTAVP